MLKWNENLQRGRDAAILSFQDRILDIIRYQDIGPLEKMDFLKIVKSNLFEFISTRLQEDHTYHAETIQRISSIFYEMGEILSQMNAHYQISEIYCPNRIYEVIYHRDFRYIYSGEDDTHVYMDMKVISNIHKATTDYSILYNGEIQEDLAIDKIKSPGSVILLKEYLKLYKEKYPDPEISSPIEYKQRDYYEFLQNQDLLIRNPYESYQEVLDFIHQMCTHPKIQSIFMTIYRTARNSKIVQSLKTAVSLGKQVFVYVESTARGNEELNLQIIHELTSSGVHVRSNYFRYKVHAKTFCAVDEDHRKYIHVATGNYNEDTGKQYTDCHYFTTNTEVTSDVLRLLLGLFGKNVFMMSHTDHSVYCSPSNLRMQFHKLIREQTSRGYDGIICIKCNHLYDKDIIRRLQYAATRGVQINILCRTGCGLLPSDNIDIRSKVGKYLEHDRMYLFGDKGYISSADLLTRNLSNRVEILCEVDHDQLQKYFYQVWNDPNIFHYQKDGRWVLS